MSDRGRLCWREQGRRSASALPVNADPGCGGELAPFPALRRIVLLSTSWHARAYCSRKCLMTSTPKVRAAFDDDQRTYVVEPCWYVLLVPKSAVAVGGASSGADGGGVRLGAHHGMPKVRSAASRELRSERLRRQASPPHSAKTYIRIRA